MDWFIKAFIRASLLWFAAGVLLGIAMVLHPAWIIYRPAHAHMNVVGFLTMLVFGVGYQLLPRLFGHPLYSRGLAVAHLYLANIGLAVLIAGFILRPRGQGLGDAVSSVGGVLFGLGVVCWIYNLWRTFDAADARQRERSRSPGRQLPTRDD